MKVPRAVQGIEALEVNDAAAEPELERQNLPALHGPVVQELDLTLDNSTSFSWTHCQAN